MNLGFLGLGNMGAPMARNLLRAGHALTAYNRSRSRAEELKSDGAQIADTPAHAARNEIIITMLSDDHALESIAWGTAGANDGILAAMPANALHISMSTISPALSERLSRAHAERGQLYLAAPVFGRPDAAAAAKLFIVASGEEGALAIARPIFAVLGQRTFEIDAHPEHANLVKLFGNFLLTCVIESLGEVFAASRKADLDPEKVFEVISGTLFGAPAYTGYGPRILRQEFSPAGFKMPLGLKDNRLMLEAAAALSAPMPFASIVRDRFLSAIAQGHGELDWSALTLAIAASAGLPSQPRSSAMQD